jgi:hypothetical protein
MRRIFGIVLVGLLVAGALAALLAGSAMAQDETPTLAPNTPRRYGMGRGFGPGIRDQVGLEAAAEVLGMAPDELRLQLWGGKSLADLADEAGVDLQTVKDAVTAARETAARDAIEQAVTDGRLTREHADWLLQGLDNGWLGGLGRGALGRFGPRRGFGFGGFFRGNGSAATDDV